MTGFSEYIARGAMPPKEELAAVLRKYPWFMTARILMDEPDALLALHRLSHPKKQAPAWVAAEAGEPAATAIYTARTTDDEGFIGKELIETFLSKGDYRIVPDENTPEYDAAKGSAVLDTTDDLVSEELAEIYLAQGLNAQAKEIYARLSLLNPEKSVYFAEIIGKIDSGNNQ